MQSTDKLKKKPIIEAYSFVEMGHLIPMLKTLQILQNKNSDLDISFVTGPFIKNKLQGSYPNINIVQVEDGIDQTSLKSMREKHHEAVPFMMNYLNKYFQQKTNKPDLIIADFFMLQAFNYANKNGIKFIANHPNCYTGMSSVYNTLNLERSIRVQGYTILCPMPNVPFLKIFDKLSDALRNRGVLIFNSFIGLEDPTILPCNYSLVGLLPNSVTKHQQMDSQLTDWMNGWRQNGKNKFVYISFGSLLWLSPDFTNKLVKVIQKLGYPTIWSLRSPNAHQIQSKFIYHRGWLPQQLILQQKDVSVYLTHGGWGSICQAIASSTPMVCLPVFADQQQNSKLIQKRHIAISIPQSFENSLPQLFNASSVQQQTIANAIRDIMQDPSYSQSMKRMNRLSKTHDAAQTISKIVQRLLEFGYEYLISPAYENATIKDNSVPLKDILMEKYWPLLKRKP